MVRNVESGERGRKKRVQEARRLRSGQNLAFEKLKAKLAQELAHFQLGPDRPFFMRCDANDSAIGDVLGQADPNKSLKAKTDIGKTTPGSCLFFRESCQAVK